MKDNLLRVYDSFSKLLVLCFVSWMWLEVNFSGLKRLEIQAFG